MEFIDKFEGGFNYELTQKGCQIYQEDKNKDYL